MTGIFGRLWLCMSIVGVACTSKAASEGPSDTVTGDTATSDVGPGADGSTSACTAMVLPADTSEATYNAIQVQLGDATTGTVVCLGAGEYPIQHELTIVHDGVTLRGPTTGEAVINFLGQKDGDQAIHVNAANTVVLENFTVRNAKGDGIRLTACKDGILRNLKVTWDGGSSTKNGGYGLYPVQSERILIDGCTVSYASDAGLYVGQSSHVEVKNSEAFGNVAGIELENTSDSTVHDCKAHDNTGGILVFNLPNLPVQGGARCTVHDNLVTNNNTQNFGASSSIVSQVPTGTGILVMAADSNEIFKNTVSGNESYGLAIAAYSVIADSNWKGSAGYDEFPESNFVHDNSFSGNGKNPQGLLATAMVILKLTSLEDMIWDGLLDSKKDNGKGQLRNCFSKNNGTFRFLDYANVGKNSSTDVTPWNCTYPALPAFSLP